MDWPIMGIPWQELRSSKNPRSLHWAPHGNHPVLLIHMTAATDTAASTDSLTAAFSLWKKTVEAELKGVPFEKKLVTKTFEGIALQPLYTRLDRAGLPGLETAPGEVPFIRGVRSAGRPPRRI